MVLHAPLGYGVNANPSNSVPYLNQLFENNKEFENIVEGSLLVKDQSNDDVSRNFPSASTPSRRRTLM